MKADQVIYEALGNRYTLFVEQGTKFDTCQEAIKKIINTATIIHIIKGVFITEKEFKTNDLTSLENEINKYN